jgi:ABC-type transport system substrate-binding protein
LFIPLLAKEGFKVVTDNAEHDVFFQQRIPKGDFQLAMFINVASPDPSVSGITSCDQIPGPKNQGQGQNSYWYCNPALDKLNKQADSELVTDKRVGEVTQISKTLRDDYYNLPLYVFPAMSSWRTDKVDGPVDLYINSPESNMWNLYDWSLK